MSLLRRSLMATKSLTTYTTTFTLKYEKNNVNNTIYSSNTQFYGIAFSMTISYSGYTNDGSSVYSTGLISDININVTIKRKTDGIQIYTYETTKLAGESTFISFGIIDSNTIDDRFEIKDMPLDSGLYIVEMTITSAGKITTGTSNEATFVPDEYAYLYDYKSEKDKNVFYCKCLDSIQKTKPDPAISPKGIKNEMTYFGG